MTDNGGRVTRLMEPSRAGKCNSSYSNDGDASGDPIISIGNGWLDDDVGDGDAILSKPPCHTRTSSSAAVHCHRRIDEVDFCTGAPFVSVGWDASNTNRCRSSSSTSVRLLDDRDGEMVDRESAMEVCSPQSTANTKTTVRTVIYSIWCMVYGKNDGNDQTREVCGNGMCVSGAVLAKCWSKSDQRVVNLQNHIWHTVQ